MRVEIDTEIEGRAVLVVGRFHRGELEAWDIYEPHGAGMPLYDLEARLSPTHRHMIEDALIDNAR